MILIRAFMDFNREEFFDESLKLHKKFWLENEKSR